MKEATMHPILERVAHAYAPLAGRNRLVEGPSALPVPKRPQHRLTLLALLAALVGRRA